MTVEPAVFHPSPVSEDGSKPYVPDYGYRDRPTDEAGYVREEWFVSGEADDHRYTTSVLIRRPRQEDRFSGTIVVEPVHILGAAPISLFTMEYIMRSGHGWAMICSHKSALDYLVKPSNPDRYASLNIWAAPAPPDAPAIDPGEFPPHDSAGQRRLWREIDRMNAAWPQVLAQVGAALAADGGGPFSDEQVRNVVLTGHSGTGRVVADYIDGGHWDRRPTNGSPVFGGFLQSGAPPNHPLGPCGVPIIQLVTEGDITYFLNRNNPNAGIPAYRREDSDAPEDRFRLYELAGVPHTGSRYPPHNEVSGHPPSWNYPSGARLSSLPHSELISMALDHLVRWVASDVTPPRAARIQIGADGVIAKDENGNTLGGVRCVQMDVPTLRYHSTLAANEEGVPTFGVLGTEEPLPPSVLKALYGDRSDYLDRFNRRLAELVAQGWMLPADVQEMRTEAGQASLPA